MQELSPGVFQIGKMRLDKNKKTIAFPGKLNMNKDLIEYVIVTPEGSTHESLLVAEISRPTCTLPCCCSVRRARACSRRRPRMRPRGRSMPSI
jgi:hypothetical protein